MWNAVKAFYAHSLTDLSATSSETGFPVANLLDRIVGKRWKATSAATQYITPTDPGSAQVIDYLAIGGKHNLNTIGATIVLQYSPVSDFTSGVTSMFTPQIPSNDFSLVIEMTQLSKQYTRLKISGMSDAPIIPIAYWGEAAVLDYITGSFDPGQERGETNVNITRQGNVSGVYTKYKQRICKFKIGKTTNNCYDVFKQLWDAIGQNNSLWGWETGEHSDEVYLLRLGDDFNNPRVNRGFQRDLNVNLIGKVEV